MKIDGDGGDSDLVEAEGELVADSGGDLGIPEAGLTREAVEPGAVEWDELLLGGGGHGDNRGGAGLSYLRRQFTAREDEAEQVVLVVRVGAHFFRVGDKWREGSVIDFGLVS